MDNKQVIDWILSHWSLCAFVLTMFVQVTPGIKFNPVTALFSWIGNVITAGTRKDIAELKEETRQDIAEIKSILTEQQTNIDTNEKDRIRWEVLDFANSCRNNRKHTKDEFQHIIDLHDKYEKLLQKTGDSNGVFTAEYEYIKRLYAERQEKNDFL